MELQSCELKRLIKGKKMLGMLPTMGLLVKSDELKPGSADLDVGVLPIN